jgi:DNA modification methylase
MKPWAKNPRKNSYAVNPVAESIKLLGFGAPLVTTMSKRIVAGHTRWKAAKQLKLKEVPVHMMHLSDEQADMMSLADNKLGEKAAWEVVGLAGLLEGYDRSVAEILGWSQGDLEKLAEEVANFGPMQDDREALDDAVPDPPAKPVTKLGDVWKLGDHVLVCGDCLEELKKPCPARVCLTDPPYSVNYEKAKRTLNDKRVSTRNPGKAYTPEGGADEDAAKFLGFLREVQSDVVIMSYPIDEHLGALVPAMAGWRFMRELVWAKNRAAFYRGATYSQKHEPILVLVRNGKPQKAATKHFETVLEVAAPTGMQATEGKGKKHITQKPLELWEKLVKHAAQPEDSLIDPFAGSGTTLIACERTGHPSYNIEIAPAYCDVIVERWEQMTGGKAQRA